MESHALGRHVPSRHTSNLQKRTYKVRRSLAVPKAQAGEGNACVAVVGAGPAGCLCAALMAQRGYGVHVFEQRQEPQRSDATTYRSYPMGLTSRTMHALRAAGLEESVTPHMPAPLTTVHQLARNASMSLIWEDSEFCRTYLVSRLAFTKHLYDAVREKYPDRIRWHFGHALSDVDFDHRVATFSSSSDPSAAMSQGSVREDTGAYNKNTVINYALLVGADGAGSRVRQLMQEALPDVKVDVIYRGQVTYKTFHKLPLEQGPLNLVPDLLHHEPGTHLYGFSSSPDKPALLMWRQPDATVSGAMARAVSYKAENLQECLRTTYPQMPAAWRDMIVQQTSDTSGQPSSSFNRIARVSQLHGPGVVLLGDAGHPMTSQSGQGCNIALEDCTVFAKILDSVAGLDAALPAFTSARLADVRAMQNIEYYQALNNYSSGGSPSLPELIDARVVWLSIMLSMMAHKLLPQLFPAPSILHGSLRDARKPYSSILQEMRLYAAGAIATGSFVAAYVGKMVLQLA